MLDADAVDIAIASHSHWELGWDSLVAIGTIALAIGTFWLSLATVRAESRRRKEAVDAEAMKNVAATNSAIFELLKIYNKFENFRLQNLEMLRNSPARHAELQPAIGIQWLPFRSDANSLAFLFESSEPNALGRLALVEQEIAVAIDLIKQRDTLHLTVVQVVTEGIARARGDRVPLNLLEEALGVRQTLILKALTDSIYEATDSILSGIPKVINELRSLAMAMYPGRKFMRMAVQAPSPNARSSF